jgi:hypothetical protein
MQKETPPDVQRAVAFFAQAGLSRLLTQLREKYIHVGQVGGQVLLENSTPSERREIASFLGKPPYRDANIKIRLTDFDNALQRSGFACTLPELLSAFFPDSPLVTRPEQRAAHATHQTNFRTALLSIAAELPEGSRGRQWLEQGQHGQEWLFSRYKTPQKKSKSSNFRSYTTLPMFSTSYPAPMSPNAWLSSLGEMWEIGANGRSPREAVCSSRAPPGLLLLKSVNSVRLSGMLDHDDASARVRARGRPGTCRKGAAWSSSTRAVSRGILRPLSPSAS